MSLSQSTDQPRECPPSIDDLRRQLYERLDHTIEACLNDHLQTPFFDFEKALRP